MTRAALLLVCALACAKRGARGCGDDLSGTWALESNAKFAYRILDEGKRVRLEPLFDAGGPGTPYGKFHITLERKGGSLRGATETTYTEGGKTCPVRFESRIEACTTGNLNLIGETNFDIKVATCEVSRTGAVSTSTLVRMRDNK